ncbi:MAG TPA: hypothetical protein VFV05_01830 [Methylomirabilota bacterium]|nr:hypothetical protein [Methylomirabilota bacterium]
MRAVEVGMRRRTSTVIELAGLTVLGVALSTMTQQPAKVSKVGMLVAARPTVAAFVADGTDFIVQ